MGTVTLLEDLPNEFDEEAGQNYGSLVLQYFLAEGCHFRHSIFHGGINEGTPSLPAIVSEQEKSSKKTEEDEASLKIAWRYKDQTPKNEELLGSANHHFNLNKTMPAELVNHLLLGSWHWSPNFNGSNFYEDLQTKIVNASAAFKINPEKPATNMLRISVSDIGSLVFDEDPTRLATFLFKLKALARSHLIVIVLSLSRDFFVRHEVNSAAHQQIMQFVDYVIDFTAFNKEERQTGVFRDHHGIIEVTKAAPLNCLVSAANTKTQHLFKSLRTKFSISPMHLPPDLEVQKAGEDLKKLDF